MKNAPFTGQGPKRLRNGPRMPNGTVSKPTGQRAGKELEESQRKLAEPQALCR